MLNRLLSCWRAWRLKRLKAKRDALEVAYAMNVLQLNEAGKESAGQEIRIIWLKELEQRVLRVDKKIAALDPSESEYKDYHD